MCWMRLMENWKQRVNKHRTIEEMFCVTVLILGLAAFVICGLRFLAESQRPVEYKQSDMNGEAKARAYQTLAREETR